MNLLENAFILAFQKSPIILCDGIASGMPGGVLPIIALTEGLSIVGGLLNGVGISMDLLSTDFMVAPGGTLIVQDVGEYSFLNQATAANAVVKRPNRVTMNMLKPVTANNGGYPVKPQAFTSLKTALDKHNESGGTYTILTPAFIYTACLMKSMMDVSGFSDQVKQVQYTWAFEFEQPLLMVSQLDAVLGNLMSKFSAGVPSLDGLGWSGGVQSNTGVMPS